ncbi:MAG TPA: Lrp/AsnC family transcriptional regulator [Casimicrobiaceae bacterium]|nr:Lrp/AsnC family transcriptional regulator [Casimicrobiaceae bacterium]
MPPRLQIADLLHDAKNIALIRLLRDRPRLAVSELARRVKMSAPAVRERLQRLEEAGILGWRVAVEPSALGFPICCFVRVRPAPGQLSKIADLAQRLPQVTECHRVTGEDCFILKIHIAAIGELDHVLDQFLQYGQTTTSLVQSTPVAPRLLPLPDERPPVPSRITKTK